MGASATPWHSRWQAIGRDVVPPGPDGAVWWLTGLCSLGVVAVLPFLPLFARAQGADMRFIGWMVAAYMATNLLCAVPAGWLSDHVGRRVPMALGLFGLAIASLGFLCFHTPWAFVALRGLEGASAACFMPAALAYVADRAPEGRRGTRMAQLGLAENLGLLLGPALGGALVCWGGMASPFVALALVCAVGGGLVMRLPGRAPRAAGEGPSRPAGTWRDVQHGALAGLLCRGLTSGFAVGLYESIWSVHLTSLGATPGLTAFSWTLFALPAIALAGRAGRLVDRIGPMAPLVGGALFSALVTLGYALTGRSDVTLALCLLEGVGFAFSFPAENALMANVAPGALRGRVGGLIGTVKTLGALAGALVIPPLYAANPSRCFLLTAAVLGVGVIGLGLSLALARTPARNAKPLAAAPPGAPQPVAPRGPWNRRWVTAGKRTFAHRPLDRSADASTSAG